MIGPPGVWLFAQNPTTRCIAATLDRLAMVNDQVAVPLTGRHAESSG